MMIQCLIKRDGDTPITRGGVNYVFRQNKHGHAVCEVQNDDHARIFLRMGASCYRPYGKAAEAHASALKMIPKPAAVEEVEEDEEVFSETVGIVEGREGNPSPSAAEGEGEESLFPEIETAEEAVAALPQDELVRSVAQRMIDKGEKKNAIVKQLQEQFALSQDDAREVVKSLTK